MNRLENKVAVITGAGGGIGRTTAVQFAEEGADVICQDINATSAEETAKEVEELGRNSMVWECDVSDSKSIDEMFKSAEEKLGTVNVLVNNAGVDKVEGDGASAGSPLDQIVAMSNEAWNKMLSIHLGGAFYCTRAMLRAQERSGELGGSIVCISSIAGLSGWGPLHYATAKGGLLGFVKSIARFLAPFNIRANAVCPGVIDTAMTRDVPEQMIEGLKLITPMGRQGSAEDVASAILYLVSEESSFVTGQAISPNGGLVI